MAKNEPNEAVKLTLTCCINMYAELNGSYTFLKRPNVHYSPQVEVLTARTRLIVEFLMACDLTPRLTWTVMNPSYTVLSPLRGNSSGLSRTSELAMAAALTFLTRSAIKTGQPTLAS